jgi:hypothetical protein
MNQMFNNSGQLNASSLKDALAQLVKYASILEENQPANLGMTGQSGFSDAEADDLVSRAIYTQDGKTALAQSMANPIN